MKRSSSKRLRRLLASPANAAKSTGPKTEAGKRNSSQNALDQFHVEQLAAAAWRIRRAQVFENNLAREDLEQSTPEEALHENPARALTLAWDRSRSDRALRYEATHHRLFRHHRAELRQNELTRLGGHPAAAPAPQSNQEFIQKIEEIRNEARPENTTPESEDRAA